MHVVRELVAVWRLGSSASIGTPETRSSVWRVRTVRSVASRINASATANNTPATRPSARFRFGSGLTGWVGTVGRSTTDA